MKTLTSYILLVLFCVFTSVAKADSGDSTIVANWQFPIQGWFPNSSIISGVVNNQAVAMPAPTNFDALNSNFDNVWASSTISYPIANPVNNPSADKGATDFSGAFKVFYDDANMYIFLQYTDDSHTGNESYELMFAPYYKINAIENIFAAATPGAQYVRYSAFGGYKATFSDQAFSSAMTLGFDATGAGNIGWSDSPAILAANLFENDHTSTGSNVIKKIFTIGYGALTGDARPNFDPIIWKTLNNGKGISFDIKVNDDDAGDNGISASYWWNSTSNDGYALTYYSGFLGIQGATDVKQTLIANTIYKNITSTEIVLNYNSNVMIYDMLGKLIINMKNVDKIDLNKLGKGSFIVNANNEIKKIIR